MAQVHVALAREQAVAEDSLRALQAGTLHRLAAMPDEGIHDGFGRGEQVGMFADEVHVRDGRIPALHLHHEPRRIVARDESSEDLKAPGTGWSGHITAPVLGDDHVRVRHARHGYASRLSQVQRLVDGGIHPSSLHRDMPGCVRGIRAISHPGRYPGGFRAPRRCRTPLARPLRAVAV